MAQTSWPFDSQTSTETDWSRLLRYLTTTPGGGIIGVPADTNLKVTATSSGMNVTLSPGIAIVRGHAYKNDADITLTIGTSASNPRIDSIVLALDPSANTITAAVIAGTAAASPVAPTLTQTDSGVYHLELARVAVGASVSTISAGNVTDVRPFAGGQVGVWTTSTRPAGTIGLTGYNVTTGKQEAWNGSAWVDTSVAPTWDTLSGKPSTFAPSAHTHVAADVTDQSNINAGRVNGVKLTVSSTAPSTPATGDLWFW